MAKRYNFRAVFSLLVLPLVVYLLRQPKDTGELAKTYVGDARYPTTQQWTAFNISLSGKLIKFIHPAQACHLLSGSFDLAECLKVNKEVFNATYIRESPGLINFPTWTDNTCYPLSQSLTDLSLPTLSCKHGKGKYPDYVVRAENAHDVSTALKFAVKHNLRVVIKGTGHDFLGRNTGHGSLSIWTRHIVGQEWIDQWKGPVPAPDWTGQWKGAAIRYGSGHKWQEVNDFVNARQHSVVTGGEATVGAGGGWLQGGGHGPLSHVYGLGVEQVLEFQMVTPRGDIVTANQERNSDLFWALRGGGGSTFGVLTSITYKAYPTPEMTMLHLYIERAGSSEEDQQKFYRAIDFYLQKHVDMQDFGVTAYPMIWQTGYVGVLIAPLKTAEELREFWRPIDKELTAMGVNTHYFVMTNDDIQTAKAKDIMIMWVGLLGHRMEEPAGLPVVLTSRLISRLELQQPANPKIHRLVETVLNETNAFLLPYPCIPAQKHMSRSWDLGLNPAWKNAAAHLVVLNYGGIRPNLLSASKIFKNILSETSLAVGVTKKTTTLERLRKRWATANDVVTPVLDAVSENHGAYINEGSPYEANWRIVYWGSDERYDKLLAIKKKYDPDNVLWCSLCVNHDVFTEGIDGKLYKAQIDGNRKGASNASV